MAITDYNPVPSLNTQISGINIAEGWPPPNVNNAFRQMMADIISGVVYLPTDGTAYTPGQIAAMFPNLKQFKKSTDTDDTNSFLRAVDSAAETIAVPGGPFSISSEIPATETNFVGSGITTSVITATAAMRSMFKLTGQNIMFSNIKLMCADLADSGLHIEAANSGQAAGLWIENAKKDGIRFHDSGNNNNFEVTRSIIRGSGYIYNTGTATASSGATIVPIAGASNLTLQGIRPLHDYVRFAATGSTHMIMSVSATQLEIYPPLPGALAGSAYAVWVGAAIAITNQGNNSCIKLNRNILQNSAGPAILDQSLYGAIASGNICETNGIGRTFGRRGGVITLPIGPVDEGAYWEFQVSGIDYLIEGANSGLIDNPTYGSGAADTFSSVKILDGNTCDMVFINGGEVIGGQMIGLLNAPGPHAVQFDKVYTIINGAGNTLINLPAITTGSNSHSVRSNVPSKIVFRIGTIGANQVQLRTTDGRVINGVAGATGVNVTGSYKEVVATFAAIGDWTVTNV